MKKAETPSLTYSPRNAWDVYTTAIQKRQMDALVKRYMDFLSNCKTERETVAYVQKRLQEAGFSEDFKKNAVFRNLPDLSYKVRQLEKELEKLKAQLSAE